MSVFFFKKSFTFLQDNIQTFFTWHRLYFKICLLPVAQLYFYCLVTLSDLKLFINSILITPQQLTAVAPSCSFCLKGNNCIHLENFSCLFKTQLRCHLLSLCLGSLVSEANPFFLKFSLNLTKFKIKLCSLKKRRTRKRKIEITLLPFTLSLLTCSCLSYPICPIKCIYHTHIKPQF